MADALAVTDVAGDAVYDHMEHYTPMRRRRRKNVYAVSVAAAKTPAPIIIDVQHLRWQLDAACEGMDRELFFDPTPQDETVLREVCADCPVRQTCLDYANEHRLLGFWGGTNEEERGMVSKRRRHR